MNNVMKKAGWWIFGILCVLTGFYPVVYFFANRHFGILSSKSQELLADQVWNAGFYGHIVFGGVALLIGWVQFSAYLRRTRMGLHRAIGKVYVLTALISGVCGVYIAQSATGGLSNVIGFSLSGLVWLTTTFLAYTAIRNGQIKAHQNLMIYSYAVCFSAVTLRIWLPTLTVATGDFMVAYRIVGWLSWVPNLIVAYFIINSRKKKPAARVAV
ncbi:DUF2306 domain-containing protein [Roseivirga sp. BDSF3-8]|uniref:DUF2306 domain-containing protein n=1 Tax=Roseivirga sp. BDSF3-8 TaxID=3241598 RepID=UPI003531BD59